jgi:integrase
VYRRSDGTQTTKRGFASERAARDARRRLVEQVERREVVHTKETFGDYWNRWLARRRPYLEPGTWRGYEIDGRKRLLPAFARHSLSELSTDHIRELVADLAEAVEAGDMATKTVNNTLGTLVVCLNAAVDDGLIAANPALRVQRLLRAHIEPDYLRLDEIPRYLNSCSAVYRPLAELLIGSGLRICETLALRLGALAPRRGSTRRAPQPASSRCPRERTAADRRLPRSSPTGSGQSSPRHRPTPARRPASRQPHRGA